MGRVGLVGLGVVGKIYRGSDTNNLYKCIKFSKNKYKH